MLEKANSTGAACAVINYQHGPAAHAGSVPPYFTQEPGCSSRLPPSTHSTPSTPVCYCLIAVAGNLLKRCPLGAPVLDVSCQLRRDATLLGQEHPRQPAHVCRVEVQLHKGRLVGVEVEVCTSNMHMHSRTLVADTPEQGCMHTELPRRTHRRELTTGQGQLPAMIPGCTAGICHCCCQQNHRTPVDKWY